MTLTLTVSELVHPPLSVTVREYGPVAVHTFVCVVSRVDQLQPTQTAPASTVTESAKQVAKTVSLVNVKFGSLTVILMVSIQLEIPSEIVTVKAVVVFGDTLIVLVVSPVYWHRAFQPSSY